MKKILSFLLIFTVLIPCTIFAGTEKQVAQKTPQKIQSDGEEVQIPAYIIQGKNYVKLRDFAAILSKTNKKFDISFDKQKEAVVIESGKAYNKTDKDLKENKEASAKAIFSEQIVLLDNKEVKVQTANIMDNNYLPIRDLAELVGVKIDFNNEKKIVELKTEEKKCCCCGEKTCTCSGDKEKGCTCQCKLNDKGEKECPHCKKCQKSMENKEAKENNSKSENNNKECGCGSSMK